MQFHTQGENSPRAKQIQGFFSLVMAQQQLYHSTFDKVGGVVDHAVLR